MRRTSSCLILLALLGGPGGAPAEPAAPNPIRRVRLEVRQKYEGARRVRLPIARTLSPILTALGIRVVSRKRAAPVLRVEVDGSGVSERYALFGVGPGVEMYTAAALEFRLELCGPAKTWKREFRLESAPRKRVRVRGFGGGCRKPACAPFRKPLRSDLRALVRHVVAFAGEFAGTEVIARAVTRGSKELARGATDALADMEEVAAPAPLLPLLDHARAAVRAAAARALGHAADSTNRVAAALRERLRADPDPDVRAELAISLGRLGDRDSAPALAAVASGGPRALRGKARRTLEALPDIAAIAELAGAPKGAGVERRVSALRALRHKRLPRSSRVKLRPLLRDDAPEVRFEAATLLAKLGDPECVVELMQAAVSGRERERAVRLVRRVSWPEIQPELTKRLRDASPDVRLVAAEVLSGMGDNVETAELLARLLADADARVRRLAASGLGRHHGIGHRRQLRERLGDSDAAVRRAARRSLLAHRDPEVTREERRLTALRSKGSNLPRAKRLPFWRGLLADSSASVRELAARSLTTDREPADAEDRRALAALRSDPSPEVREAAETTLALLGDFEAAKKLFAGADRLPRSAHAVYKRILPRERTELALELAGHASGEVRLFAATRLLADDSPESRARLQQLENDPDSRVRDVASIAAAGSSAAALRATLRQTEGHSPLRFQAIHAVKKALRVRPGLALEVPDVFDHADYFVRMAAVRALRASAGAVPASLVRKLLAHRHLELRIAVVKALPDLGVPDAVERLVELLSGRPRSAMLDRAVVEALFRLTGQRFPPDAAKWRQWLDSRNR